MEAVSGLTRDVLDRARRSRDARFDGRFFIAVRSTRIYCRPICPSRFSDDSNVRYYATAEEAAEAGYRPCLRCRPEAAPDLPHGKELRQLYSAHLGSFKMARWIRDQWPISPIVLASGFVI